MKKQLITLYQECIDNFVTRVTLNFSHEIIAIILQGGTAREKNPIKNWSDIDLIIIYEKYNPLLSQFLAKVSNELDKSYSLRLDINLIYRNDIKNNFRRVKYCSSEIMNALSKRNIKILYGSLDSLALDGFNEKEAVYTYLNVTLLIFRRYYIENIYYNYKYLNYKMYLQRILRMVFSIIRSSLRLLNIYVNPYLESLIEIKKLNILSLEHIKLLEDLIYIRNNFNKLNVKDDKYFIKLFADIEYFVEYYINYAIDNFNVS